MPTANSLRAAGFTVEPSQVGVSCSEISSAEPFSYFNNNFCSTPAEIAEGLLLARQVGDRYVLLFAGTPTDTDEIPFTLLNAEQTAVVQKLNSEIQGLKENHAKALVLYNDALDCAQRRLEEATAGFAL